MSNIPARSIDWDTIASLHTATRLDISKANLADVFEKYFLALDDAVKSAQSFYENFGKYRPVLTIVSDMPRFVVDEERSLAEYDALEGEPLWLR